MVHDLVVQWFMVWWYSGSWSGGTVVHGLVVPRCVQVPIIIVILATS